VSENVTLEASTRIVRALAARGYNAEREAVTLLAASADPETAIDRALEAVPESAVVVTAEHVEEGLKNQGRNDDRLVGAGSENPVNLADVDHPSVSTGNPTTEPTDGEGVAAVETEGSSRSESASENGGTVTDTRSQAREKAAGVQSSPSPSSSSSSPSPSSSSSSPSPSSRSPQPPAVSGDVTSTGTGEYSDFVAVFRDRYERLAAKLRGRVTHRPTSAVASMPGGSDAAIIGMVSDVRSTAGGHWLVELEDTTGTFPALVMSDREFAEDVRTLLRDEVIAVQGTLADDAGILFVDSLYFPDVPRTYSPSTADRHVEAALISDVHVGSQEFLADAWERFAAWLHTEEAESVEYLLIAGDMVEGVGVYPNQDEELEIVDIYDQYETFSEHLKDVPGDLEIVMIPGNHDAVRLAEPQPAFDEELRELMSAHDAQITANPSTVTVEGVSVLMYHGSSLDEVIAELPETHASYEQPHRAMSQLLRKRHIAPQYGGMTRIAPEESDHLVIDDVPDIFHAGHVHKLGYGTYHNVLVINSSCWQAQTDFQKSVNLDPDVGFAPIVDLSTLELTVRQFV